MKINKFKSNYEEIRTIWKGYYVVCKKKNFPDIFDYKIG